MTQQDLPILPAGASDLLPGSQKAPTDTTAEEHIEYLVVSDKNSEVILSSEDLGECRKLATKVRKCGGSVTIFKSLKF
jgi:hypothetical protein